MASKLFDARRRDTMKAWAIDECYFRKPAPLVLDRRDTFYNWIVDHLGSEVPLTYLEFGVAHGDSIKFFSEKFVHKEANFIGFDSFQGLPEPWLHMPRFFFGRNGQPPGNTDARVRFVKGWFQNTVAPFLADWIAPTEVVFVHYDADLYGSTLFALTQVWRVVHDYYFMMDDFLYDDSVALFDFASAFPVEIEFLAQAGQDGNGKLIPLKVFGRIRNKEFVPAEASSG